MMQYVTKEGNTTAVLESPNDLFDLLRQRVERKIDMPVVYREFAKVAAHPNILFRDVHHMDSSELCKLLGAGQINMCFVVLENIDIFIEATSKHNFHYVLMGVDDAAGMTMYLYHITKACFDALTRAQWLKEFLDEYIETL